MNLLKSNFESNDLNGWIHVFQSVIGDLNLTARPYLMETEGENNWIYAPKSQKFTPNVENMKWK